VVQFSYRLTETLVRVSARIVTISDPFASSPQSTRIDDLAALVADAAQLNTRIIVDVNGRGDKSIEAAYTADGRLASVSYDYEGPGAVIVGGVVKLAAFVGSLLLSAGPAGLESPPGAEPPGWNEWLAEHQAAGETKAANVALANDAAARLLEIRHDLLTASAQGVARLAVQERAAQRTLAAAREEIARIDAQFVSWRDAKRTTTEASISRNVALRDIPARAADAGLAPPASPTEGSPQWRLWADYGLYLEIEDSSRESAPSTTAHNEGTVSGASVLWRLPRRVMLWVWRRPAADADESAPVLVSVASHSVVDRTSPTRKLELTGRAFGASGAELSFHDDGTPAKLSHSVESAWGAAFAALGDAPEAIAGAVGHAKTVAENVGSLTTMGAERAKEASERDLAVAKSRLELAGVHATERDYAALQEAEQAVKLNAARHSLDTAETLDDAQRAVQQERAQAAVEKSLAELKLELAEVKNALADARAEV
jgi:hypothetical protein